MPPGPRGDFRIGSQMWYVAYTILSANIKIRLHMKKLLGHVISAEDFPSNLTCVLGFTTTE